MTDSVLGTQEQVEMREHSMKLKLITKAKKAGYNPFVERSHTELIAMGVKNILRIGHFTFRKEHLYESFESR